MRTLPFLLVASLVAACGSEPDPRLEPLSRATISLAADEESAVLFGDLRLGETTLGEVVDRFGCQRADGVVSDQMGIELVYEKGALEMLFLYDENPRDDAEVAAWRAAPRDLAAFLGSNPARREMKLASVAVSAGSSPEETFFRGNLDCGARLLDPLMLTVAKLDEEPADERPPMLAGARPDLPDSRTCFPNLGLVLYGEDQPADPADPRITRIALFVPGAP